MSPEIVYQQSHGFAVDVWCLGILLYEMLHGKPPFKAENLKQIKTEFRNKKLKIKPSVDSDVVDLIKKLLNFDSKERISVDEMLQHRAFSKNMRHIRRPITQEEYRLLVKYYYMNSGGTNLNTHNNEYIKQLKRESALTKTPVRSKKSISENRYFVNIVAPFQNENERPEGLAPNETDLAKLGTPNNFRKNNFEPKKFQTPASNIKSTQPLRGNDFRPNKFITPHKIPSNLQSGLNRGKNDDIRFYNPPKMLGETGADRKSDFRKKPKPEIQKEDNKNAKTQKSIKKNFSSLKKKLKLKDRIKKEQNSKNNHSKSKQKNTNEPRKLTLTQLRNQTKNKFTTDPKKLKQPSRPLQNRSLSLQKLINSSLVSHQSTNFNSRGKTNTVNIPQHKMTLSQFQSQYSSHSGASAKNNTARYNRFEAEAKAKPDFTQNPNKPKTMKRETSQNIEQSMNVRVIKASMSLPKHKFAKPNQFKKTNLNELKNNLQVAGRQNQAQKLDKLFKSFKPKTLEKEANLKNYSSINYKIEEVIPEELYLSQFQTVQNQQEKPESTVTTSMRVPSGKSPLFVKSTHVVKSFEKANSNLRDSPSPIKTVYLGQNKSKSHVLRVNPVRIGSSERNPNTRKLTQAKTATLRVDHSKLNFVKNKTSATEILNQESQTSLPKNEKSKSIFQDYNFERDSLTGNSRGSQNSRSDKNYSSVQSLSEKSEKLNSTGFPDSKTRDIAFNNLSTQNSQATLKKNLYQNTNKLSDIREESFTMNTHTTTLKDLEPPKNKTPEIIKLKSGVVTTSTKPNKLIENSNERKYIKRISYVNGIKKIQMVLSQVNSPLKSHMQTQKTENVQRTANPVSNKPPVRKISQMENPALKKNSLRERIEEIKKKGSEREHGQSNIQIDVLNQSENTREKRKIRWMNYDTTNTDFVESMNQFDGNLRRRQTDLIRREISPNREAPRTIVRSGVSTEMRNLSDQKKEEPQARIHSTRRDWKNYSYGVGDKLHELISQNNTSDHNQRYENSKVAQVKSPFGQSPHKKTAEARMKVSPSPGKETHSPFSRFSMNKNFEKPADLIGYSRGSVPLQNIHISNPILHSKERKNVPSTKKILNFESSQWKQNKAQENHKKILEQMNAQELKNNKSNNKQARFAPVIKYSKEPGTLKMPTQNNQVQKIESKSPNNLKNQMSINIKQLPGLKESHSTGRLQATSQISHSKNRSIDISKTNFRANSQLRKVIDPQGNVRYKFINRPKRTELKVEESLPKNYSSLQRKQLTSFTQSKHHLKKA